MNQSILRGRISILIVALVFAPLCCYFLIPNQCVEKELLKQQLVTLAVAKKNETEDLVKPLGKDKPRQLQAILEATRQNHRYYIPYQNETEDVVKTDKLEGKLPAAVIDGIKTLVFFSQPRTVGIAL